MKNRLLLFVSFVFILIQTQAQVATTKVELTWGEEQVLNRRTSFEDIIGADSEATYIIKRTRKGELPLIIEKYNNDMLLQKSLPFQLGEGKDNRIYQYATQIDGALILFSTVLDNKATVNSLYAQTIDKDSLNQALS